MNLTFMIIFQLPKRREAEKEGHFNYTFPSNKETHLQTTHILTYIIEYINVIICIQCKPMIISSRQDNYFPFLHSDMNPAVVMIPDIKTTSTKWKFLSGLNREVLVK